MKTEGEQIAAHELAKRAEDYGRWEDAGEVDCGRVVDVPDKVLVMTAGGDVQRDRIEVFFMGHGIDREVWCSLHGHQRRSFETPSLEGAR
jgi:phage terminase large subunit GpA-like protein